MNKKITSLVLVALMIAGSTSFLSFPAFAAMPKGTVIIGTKAFDLTYANNLANVSDITNAIAGAGSVYVKDFNGNWTDNVTGLKVDASLIPAATYKNANGVVTSYYASDKDVVPIVAVAVSSVSAISTSSFKVDFTSAPVDTSKVVFAVKGSAGTAVSTTVTWNTANTEATVSSSYNLTSDTYSVNVIDDTTDLGATNVTITQQAVAKISITSTVLAVVPGVVSPTTPNAGKGFSTYKVTDQYGTDITSTPLGNNINWTVGIGVVDSALTKKWCISS